MCRFNGGAQAGHTVETDGDRHIFHHFGAGTLQGACTHLSRFFIHNPYFFIKERQELRDKFGITPVATADPRGLVTTPYDMMLNQMAEEARGTARHGSCGIGINETIKRHEAYQITVEMLKDDPRRLNDTLYEIRHNWVPARAESLGLNITPVWQTRIDNLNVVAAYFDAISQFNVELLSDDQLSKNKSIIFEGAQGLLLDEDHHFFPYVTHSHTGLHNVMILAKEMGLTCLNVFYITRAYATRHGVGPFPHETSDIHYKDLTNVPNDWQGTLRFGLLDLDLLEDSIDNDLKHVITGIDVQTNIVVTCLDQVGDTIHFISDGKEEVTSLSEFLEVIAKRYNVSCVSYGPTQDDIRKM